MSWQDHLQKLSHGQVREIAALCSGAALLISVAVMLSGSTPFLPQSVTTALQQDISSQSAAVPYWQGQQSSFPNGSPYNRNGCPFYTNGSPYYNPDSCYMNMYFGVLGVTNAGGAGAFVPGNVACTTQFDSGSADRLCSQWTASAGNVSGTAVVLKNRTTQLDWSCLPSQTGNIYRYHNVDWIYGWVVNLASSATITASDGETISTGGALSGLATISPIGNVGDTVTYTLTCSGPYASVKGSKVLQLPVKISYLSISANPTTVKQGDSTQLTLLANNVQGGSCKVTSPTGATVWSDQSAPPSSFSYVGSPQTWKVPTGVTNVSVEVWGAGGGGKSSTGGAGGYTRGALPVVAGQVYTIIIGQGGIWSTSSAPSTYGGGGSGTYMWGGGSCGVYYEGGSGGGRSAIRDSSGKELITAGGGGGGFSDKTCSGSFNYGAGAGGGSSGTGRSPGTQTSGYLQYLGQPASSFSANPPKGGGGSGWWGGVGFDASFASPLPSSGGSGHCDSSLATCTTTAGSGTTPFTASANYVAGVAVGGTDATSYKGGNGLIKIISLVNISTTIPSGPVTQAGNYTLSCLDSGGNPESATAFVSLTSLPTATITGNGSPNSVTVTPGETVHLVATFSPSGSYTGSAINDNNQNALTSQNASSPKTYDFNTPGNPAAPGSYPFTAAVQTSALGWANNYGKTFTVTVAGTCPANCPGPSAPNCTPINSGYTYNSSNNTCPAKSACVPAWLCTSWSTCSSGGTQTCTGAVDTNSCGVATGNPVGSSQSCTPPPPIITTFSANPSRVHKSTPTSVTFTWSGANLPASCTVTGTGVNVSGATSATASVNISAPTLFTLTCGSAHKSLTIGLIPVYIEI